MTKPVFVLLSVLMHVFPLDFRHHESCKLNQIFSRHMRKCSDNSHVQPYMTYLSRPITAALSGLYSLQNISPYHSASVVPGSCALEFWGDYPGEVVFHWPCCDGICVAVLYRQDGATSSGTSNGPVATNTATLFLS